MERADPLLLLVSLPLVPVGLVLGKMIRWEDAVSHPLSVIRLSDKKFIRLINFLLIFIFLFRRILIASRILTRIVRAEGEDADP